VKSIMLLVATVMLALAVPVRSASADQLNDLRKEGKSIALVNIQVLDSSAMARMKQSLEESLHVPIRTVDSTAASGQDLLAVGRACVDLMTTNDAAFVTLAAVPGFRETFVAAPDQNWAVVNVATLKEGATAGDLYALRVERQVVRAISALFGVAYCQEPHCVSKHVTSIAQLDELGRNLCPPSLEQFQIEARQRGMQRLAFYRKKWLIEHGYLKPDATAQTNRDTSAPAIPMNK
jgi:hypothetical protein